MYALLYDIISFIIYLNEFQSHVWIWSYLLYFMICKLRLFSDYIFYSDWPRNFICKLLYGTEFFSHYQNNHDYIT